MDAERWQRIKSILEKALEITPELRADLLDKSCGNDKDLRLEVENLLRFEEPESDLLEKEAVSEFLEKDVDSRNFINQQIEHYKIIDKLGVGGMGAVYLAERADGEFRKKAAIKLIKRGMDSDAVLRRFINERQILASLDHPNIAHLIDGGTTDEGLPYFVMEYVEGVPVQQYAAEQNLSLIERLVLFREVCSAVSYAHQNLVIHRDLKPSNILITKDGKAKLLDFGIAKLLDAEASDHTATQMRIFTPEYASPEQIRGERLTTATDIYSLGVVLYELLTGRRPHQAESENINEIIKSICETEPERPSSVVSQNPAKEKGATFENKNPRTLGQRLLTNPKPLRGDLDNIILKSLRKEAERRYSSVEQFSEDIRRYIVGLPVVASADTWAYHAAKFIRRNRLAFNASVLILLTLIGGLAATLWQNQIARRERDRAERRSDNLRKVSNSLVSEIERAIRDLPGSLPARKLLLERAIEQLDGLAAESDGNTGLQLEVVWAYQNLGAMPDQKLSDRQKIYEKAVALTERILAAEPGNLKAHDRLAMLYLDMIVVSRLRGDPEYTLEYNRRAVSIVEGVLREDSGSLEYKDSFWTANYHYGITLQQLGHASESIETARKILPVAEEMYSFNSEDGYNFMKPHLTRLQIGVGLNYAGEYKAAIKEFEAALSDCLAEAAKRPENTILQRNEANIRLQLASALENAGDPDSAIMENKAALGIREQMAAQSPRDPDLQIAAADAELSLGQLLMRQGQASPAEANFHKALGAYQKVAELDTDRLQAKVLSARTQAALGNAITKKGNLREGLNYLRSAVNFYESAGAASTIDAGLKRHYAEALSFFAAAVLKEKSSQSITEAGNLYRQSLDLWRELEKQGTLKDSDSPRIEEVSRLLADAEKNL